MATNARTPSISEDWEELQAISGQDSIYDDTASILSLSTTIAESEDGVTDEQAPPNDTILPPTYEPPRTETRVRPFPPFEPTLAETRTRQQDDTGSVASVETVTEDLLDVIIDPPMLLSTVDSLLATTYEVIAVGTKLYTSPGHMERVGTALQKMLNMLIEIEEVASCYARLWNPNDPQSRMPPLDPTLYKWCSDCAITLLALQAELDGEFGASLPQGRVESDGFSSLDTALSPQLDIYCTSLEGFCEDMGAFLPIMKVDLNEYQTPQLNFPTYAPSQNYPTSRRNSLNGRYVDTENIVTGPLADLRRQLYSLKDEIERTNGFIRDCKVTQVFSSKGMKAISKLQAAQTCTSRALSVLLSNHGGDWIDQTLAGGLSFAEFSNLSSDTIREYEREFRRCGDELERQRFAKEYRSNSAGTAESSRKRTTSSERQRWIKCWPDIAKEEDKGTDVEMGWEKFEYMRGVIKNLNILLKVNVDDEDEGKEEQKKSSEICKTGSKDIADEDMKET